MMILQGDVMEQLATLADESVHCVVTSTPYYGLRSYLPDDHPDKPKEIGLEPTIEEYVAKMVAVFREVKRALRKDGTLWLNLGDKYANDGKWGGQSGGKNTASGAERRKITTGLKPKDMCGIPWRVALALQADGWWLRSDIIWHKPNPMPGPQEDRPTSSYEHIFLLAKSARYYYDAEAVKEVAQSGPSDVKKMLEGKDRIGGKNKDADDPLLKASKHTNIGRKRSVGGSVAKQDQTGNPTYTGFNDRYQPLLKRNLRDVWTIATQPYPDAHFATFPERIPKLAILAGTSAKGVCAECGAPWERVVEHISGQHNAQASNYQRRQSGGLQSGGLDSTTIGGEAGYNKMLGWQPTCDHDLKPVPATVLDPFIGSGTVGQVATQLGREWIGIELNPDYIPMIKQRTAVTGALALTPAPKGLTPKIEPLEVVHERPPPYHVYPILQGEPIRPSVGPGRQAELF